MTIRFFVVGDPKGQPRIKAARRGRFIHVYTPKSADDWKAAVILRARQAVQTVLTGPVQVDLRFLMDRPKSHSNKAGLKPDAPRWFTGKPDRDNLDKAVLDALTTAGVWRDDAQVCAGSIEKLYCMSDQVPGVFVTIKDLTNENNAADSEN